MRNDQKSALQSWQWEALTECHAKALRDYRHAGGSLLGLLLIVPVLAATLLLEFALMNHTMGALLEEGGPDQPATALALSSLLAIIALHVMARRLADDRINEALTRIGFAALIIFLAGFGLIVAMTNFEIAAQMLFAQNTGLEAIDALLGGAGSMADATAAIVDDARRMFGDIGGLIALILVSLGLGGIFFLTILVSHFLIDLGLKLLERFVRTRTLYADSRRLLRGITRHDRRLQRAARALHRLERTSIASRLEVATAALVMQADTALRGARHMVHGARLIREEDRDDQTAMLGLARLGLPQGMGGLDRPALERALASIEEAVDEHELRSIGLAVAVDEFGKAEDDHEDDA